MSIKLDKTTVYFTKILIWIPVAGFCCVPKLESFEEARLSLPWLCIDVEDDPLELVGPALLILPELFCLTMARAFEEAIVSLHDSHELVVNHFDAFSHAL